MEKSQRDSSWWDVAPDIAKQWHPSKNSDATPESTTPGMRKKMWWICELGHEWETPINNRLLGNGCLVCSNKRVLVGFNDLETTHPQLAEQWNSTRNLELTPQDIVAGSKKKVWWLCDKGHEWQAGITYRANGSGCLVCLNKIVVVGANDLPTTHPLLEKQWDYEANGDFSPFSITAGYAKRVSWKCDVGHEFSLSPAERTRRTSAISLCPVCDNRTLVAGSNDFGTEFPVLAKQWDYSKNTLKPSEVFSGSGTQAWWRCEKDHSWSASLVNRTSNGTGCPICTKVRFLSGFNDLATTHPQIASEWDASRNPNSPSEVTSGYPKKVWWLCELGHSYDATVTARASRETGCPFCANMKVLVGFNDLGTTHPEIASEIDVELSDGFTSQDVTAGSQVILKWRCANGHVISRSVKRRVKVQQCSVCSNYQLEVGYNDLASVSPHLLSELAEPDFDATTVSAFSDKKLAWKCSLGHVYQASIRNRTQQGSGCGVCSGRFVLSGFNDLRTRVPEVLEMWNYERNLDVRPEYIATFSSLRVWWKCDRGHEWQGVVANISSGSGCPTCAPGGFDSSKPGILYFIQNREMMANKIGITNQGIRTLRIQHFEKLGWKRISEHPMQSGIHTREAETLLLRWIRTDLGLPPYLSKNELKGGWSETFSMDALSDEEVTERIKQVIDEVSSS